MRKKILTRISLLAKTIFASKNYFCQSCFNRGKYRFYPLTGKNLPNLVDRLIVLCFLVHFQLFNGRLVTIL